MANVEMVEMTDRVKNCRSHAQHWLVPVVIGVVDHRRASTSSATSQNDAPPDGRLSRNDHFSLLHDSSLTKSWLPASDHVLCGFCFGWVKVAIASKTSYVGSNNSVCHRRDQVDPNLILNVLICHDILV